MLIPKQTLLILAILLIEGFLTISIEVLSIRQLMPFVGSSVIVTSLIIGVFLLFLSIGYYQGGLYQGDYLNRLKRNFVIASLLVGIGLSYPFCNIFFYMSSKIFPNALLLKLTLYLLLILAPLIYLLGQTLPLTTNLFQQASRISKISGTALFINTLGSFLGAIITSLVLLNFLGVAFTVWINVLLLLIIAMGISFRIKKDRFYHVLYLVGGSFFLFNFNVPFEKENLVMANHYGNYRVSTPLNSQYEFSALIANQAVMSMLYPNKKGAPYIEKIKEILFENLNLQNKKILVIGAGGFSLSYEKTFNNTFTYIDIDKNIKKISENYFLQGPIKGDFIAADARDHIANEPHQYDVIVSDSYSDKSLPASLTTVNYFLLLKQRLVDNGIIIFNVIADPFLRDGYSKHIDNSIAHVFKNCMKIPLTIASLTNILYVCNKTYNEHDRYYYTDDHNRVALEKFQVIH